MIVQITDGPKFFHIVMNQITVTPDRIYYSAEIRD